jgi:hypothetical protein
VLLYAGGHAEERTDVTVLAIDFHELIYEISTARFSLQFRIQCIIPTLLCKKKVKLSRYRPEQAHGRSGWLRPRIFLTFGTRRW